MLPITLVLSETCQRCGLLYAKKQPDCPHCQSLTDVELKAFIRRRAEELVGIKYLGRLFFAVAAVLLVFSMVVFFY